VASGCGGGPVNLVLLGLISEVMYPPLILLRYAWAFPATVVGLLLALVALLIGAKGRWIDGVLEVAGGRVVFLISLLPRRLQFVAITFGHVILGLDHAVLQCVRPHEHVHVRQYERWGLLFFPLYLGSSLRQLLNGRDPYLNNHFEREAFAVDAFDEA
jgi:hypothetical protein